MKRAGLLLIAVMMSVCLGTAWAAGTARAANPDPLATSSEKLCVAVPIFGKKSNTPSAKGECPDGQQEISNDPAYGGAIVYYLKEILKLANILVGAIIILAIIISGIQYMTSGGDPANIKKAKGRLMNAFTALVLYMLMVAILNFLIPGGAL